MCSYRSFALTALLTVLTVSGCAEPKPDYRIKVMSSASGRGTVAVPPECASWYEEGAGPFSSNQPWPTYGCSEARNLAAMVEDPHDLIEGKPLGAANGIVTSSAMMRYEAGKTTPLIDPNAHAPTAVDKLQDSRMGGATGK